MMTYPFATSGLWKDIGTEASSLHDGKVVGTFPAGRNFLGKTPESNLQLSLPCLRGREVLRIHSETRVLAKTARSCREFPFWKVSRGHNVKKKPLCYSLLGGWACPGDLLHDPCCGVQRL